MNTFFQAVFPWPSTQLPYDKSSAQFWVYGNIHIPRLPIPLLAGNLGFAQISCTAKYGEDLSSRGPWIEPLPVWRAMDNVQWAEWQGKGTSFYVLVSRLLQV